MKKGDKVKIKDDPRELTGTIYDIHYPTHGGFWGYGPVEYEIEFDDKTLIPPRMKYVKDRLELLLSGGEVNCPVIRKCECGVDAIGVGKHSDWCFKSKYEK